MDKPINEILAELDFIELKDQQLIEWSIPSPLQKVMGFIFKKILPVVQIYDGYADVVALYKQGKTLDAVVRGLETIGWFFPAAFWSMTAYEAVKYLYENKDEILKLIDDKNNEKPPSTDKIEQLKAIVQKLEQRPERNTDPRIQQFLDAYYAKYGK